MQGVGKSAKDVGDLERVVCEDILGANAGRPLMNHFEEAEMRLELRFWHHRLCLWRPPPPCLEERQRWHGCKMQM